MTSPPQSATAPALLTALDDFCVHQSANVVRRPVSDSPNVYDRYFANGFARDGSYYFAISLGRFANRQVMDAAITFQLGGVHHSFFASRRDPEDPTRAEVAFVTGDVWQGLGVATELVRALAEAAWRAGIRSWFGALFSDNRTTRNLLSRVGTLSDETEAGSGIVHVFCRLDPPDTVRPERSVESLG